MVFGSIFGNPVKLSLTTDKSTYQPGERLSYRIDVTAKKDTSLKELRVELIGVLRGKTTCWYKDEEEDEEYPRTTEYSIIMFRREQKLLGNTKLNKGTHTYSGSFELPIDAIHSGKRGILEAEWILKAEAKRTLRSTKTEKRITLTSSSENSTARDIRLRLGEIDITLEVPEHIRAGTALKGVLKINTETGAPGQSCKELLLELTNKLRIERYAIDANAERCDEADSTQTIAKIKLANNLEVNQAQELPFEIQIPRDMVPSFDTGRAYSQWVLKVTCKKGLIRKDEAKLNLKIV